MPKKRGYDHRLLACVQRGICVEGIDLPVINPAEDISEGRLGACGKTRRKTTKKKDEREQKRSSDGRLVELYLQKRKSEREKSIESGLIQSPGDGENSLEVALLKLRNKARSRELNKLGAELEDIKDRMVNVVDEYDDLLSNSPYDGPMDMEISGTEMDRFDKWRGSVNDLIHGYANTCSQREKVLKEVYQNFPSDDEEEKAPSIVEDDIEAVERAGAEISENLQSVQVKARKLNFLHYTILKSSVKTQDLGFKAHREHDIQKKVVDRFKNSVKVSNEKKSNGAWKFAAEEIVDLLKSGRKEETFKNHEVEKRFNELLSAFNSQSELLEVANDDLMKQRQIATIAKQEKEQMENDIMLLQDQVAITKKELKASEQTAKRFENRLSARLTGIDDEELYPATKAKQEKEQQNDNMLLQDQIEITKKELEASEQTAKSLENRLNAHLADIDDEELYKPVSADDEERKEFIFIQRTRKIKARVDELEKENTHLQSDNNSLQESLEEAKKAAEVLTKEPEVNVFQDSSPNFTILQENFKDISEELAVEQDRVTSLENDLSESQAQIQKLNQELVQMKQQNNRLLLMTQKVESTDESTISLQSSQSMLSAQPSFCPPEVSNDQLSSADESGYTSHEISTLELKNFRKRLSRVEERRNSVADCSTQTTDEIQSAVFDKAIQVETDAKPLVNTESRVEVNTEKQQNIKDISRMINQKAFDEDFVDTLDKQLEIICHNIVRLTGLASAITSRPGSDVSLSLPKITADLGKTDLDKTNLHKTNFETTSFEEINTEKADVDKDIWETADLEKENIGTTNFDKSKSQTTNLEQSESESTNLEETNFWVTNLHEADMEETKSEVIHSEKTNLETADLEKTNLVAINLEETNSGIADSEKTTFETTKFEGTILENENFANEENKSIRAQESDAEFVSEIQNKETSLPVANEDLKSKSSAEIDFEPMNLKKSLAALRDEFKQFHDNNGIGLEHLINDSAKDRLEFTLGQWKPKWGINKVSEAAFVVYSLKHFAEKSWKKFDAGVRRNLDKEDVSDEHKVNEHIKLMAKHASKILQVIGVSILEMSLLNKRSNLKRDISLPLIKTDAVSKHSGAQLSTEKSGIWLPNISMNSSEGPVIDYTSEELEEASTAGSAKTTEVKERKQNNKRMNLRRDASVSLPLIKTDAESKHSGAKLKTAKTGIWLSNISLNLSEGPVIDYTSEELEKASTAGNIKTTEVKTRMQNNKQLTLPLIQAKRTEPPKRPKNFPGIGGHPFMASKSQPEKINEGPLSHNQRPLSCYQRQRETTPERKKAAASQSQKNFRTSRILGKNKKLVALLSKSGKSPQEINSLLGLNQASSEEQPISLANGVNPMPSSPLGMSSKPIALPKLNVEEPAKNDTQTLTSEVDSQLGDLKAVFSATTIIPIELPTQKSGILSMGSSYGPGYSHGQQASVGPAFTLSVGNGVPNADSSLSTKNVPGKVPEKRRPLPRPGYFAEKKKMMQPFKITGGGIHAKDDRTSGFPNVNVSRKANKNTNSIRESLFEQRKQRRVGNSAHHQRPKKLQLPQLSIKKGF